MSSFGLQVSDASGTVQVTVTDNLTRILSSSTISVNGSFTNANLANGRIWCAFTPSANVSNTSYVLPAITGTNSGSTTVTWKFADPSVSLDGTLLIGLY